jgi:hypothetical protein
MTDEDRIDQEYAGASADAVGDEGPAGEPADAAAPPVLTPGQPAMKRCVCCGSIIPLPALNCPTCRSWVALWEGSIAKEYFYLLAAALTCAFGALLPWKPLPDVVVPGHAAAVIGLNYMSGAVIFFFSVICALVCLYNIRSKRLVFWPILLLLVENLFTLAVYFMTWEMKIGGESYRLFSALGEVFERGKDWQEGLWNIYRTQGLGIYFVVVGTLFILVQIVVSVIRAASKGSQPAKKPVSGAARGRRR